MVDYTKVNGASTKCKVLVNYTTNQIDSPTKVIGATINSSAEALSTTSTPNLWWGCSITAISIISNSTGSGIQVVMGLNRGVYGRYETWIWETSSVEWGVFLGGVQE